MSKVMVILAEIEKIKKVVTFMGNLFKRHKSKVDEGKEPVKFSEEDKMLSFDELLEEAKASLKEEG